MNKLLLILLCLPILFISCVSDSQKEKKNGKKIKNSFSENVVIGFNVISKNPELTTKKSRVTKNYVFWCKRELSVSVYYIHHMI